MARSGSNFYHGVGDQDSELLLLASLYDSDSNSLVNNPLHVDVEGLLQVKDCECLRSSQACNDLFIGVLGDAFGIFSNGEFEGEVHDAILFGVKRLRGLYPDWVYQIQAQELSQILAGPNVVVFDDGREHAFNQFIFNLHVDCGVGIFGQLARQVHTVFQGHLITLQVNWNQIHSRSESMLKYDSLILNIWLIEPVF